jgi:hypothetical protein
MTIEMTADGFVLGVVGDVTGDGKITAYDGALILESTVKGKEVFPPYQACSVIEKWLEAYGQKNSDIMGGMADTDGGGYIDAFDAALVVQLSAGIISDFSSYEMSAPVVSSAHRNARLKVNSCDDGRLELSIDLDDVSDVCSADIVMTYDPRTLTVADVSKTSSISEWLFAEGAESGQLRIALAGASQPAADGSLVTVSFDAVSADAIKQLDITEFKLNGGRLRAAIENLPKAFALLQNYPNPFNPETWIPYRLSEPADVSITIYNVNGQMVRRLDLGSKMPGHYADKPKAAYWDGRNEWGERVSSGIYFYQLKAGRDASVGKMILVK